MKLMGKFVGVLVLSSFVLIPSGFAMNQSPDDMNGENNDVQRIDVSQVQQTGTDHENQDDQKGSNSGEQDQSSDADNQDSSDEVTGSGSHQSGSQTGDDDLSSETGTGSSGQNEDSDETDSTFDNVDTDALKQNLGQYQVAPGSEDFTPPGEEFNNDDNQDVGMNPNPGFVAEEQEQNVDDQEDSNNVHEDGDLDANIEQENQEEKEPKVIQDGIGDLTKRFSETNIDDQEGNEEKEEKIPFYRGPLGPFWIEKQGNIEQKDKYNEKGASNKSASSEDDGKDKEKDQNDESVEESETSSEELKAVIEENQNSGSKVPDGFLITVWAKYPRLCKQLSVMWDVAGFVFIVSYIWHLATEHCNEFNAPGKVAAMDFQDLFKDSFNEWLLCPVVNTTNWAVEGLSIFAATYAPLLYGPLYQIYEYAIAYKDQMLCNPYATATVQTIVNNCPLVFGSNTDCGFDNSLLGGFPCLLPNDQPQETGFWFPEGSCTQLRGTESLNAWMCTEPK